MNLLLPSVLKELYFKTSRLSRQVFWSVFVALNLVFAFHTAQFLWGNHDWMKVYGAFKLNQSFYTNISSTGFLKAILCSQSQTISSAFSSSH